MHSEAPARNVNGSRWLPLLSSVPAALLMACALCGCAMLRGREYARCEGGWYTPPGRGVTVAVGWVYDGAPTQIDTVTREYLADALRDALRHNGLLHSGTAKPELTLFCHIRDMTCDRGIGPWVCGGSVSLGVLCGVANSSGDLVALVDVSRGVHGTGHYGDAWRRTCRAVARDVANCLGRGQVVRPR